MEKRIAVIGAGAIGGYTGGQLAHNGFDVTLIDPWPEHIEAIRRDGLAIEGVTEEEFVLARPKTMHLTEVQQLTKQKPIDIAMVAVKSYDTQWAAALIGQYLAPDGYVVSLQNCMNEERIAGIVGWERTVGAIPALLAAELYAPGRVRRTVAKGASHYEVYRVGEVHGRITRRLEELAAMIATIDTVKPTRNLWGERWSKLLRQRHAERHRRLDRPLRQRHGPARPDPPAQHPSRRRGGARRPGARLPARTYPHARSRNTGARRRGRSQGARRGRSRQFWPRPARTPAATCSAPRWARTCSRAGAPRSISSTG